MSLLHKPGHDDRELERYLLGLLPPDEAERVDELSVVDEDTAWRLKAVEHDLVDGYVSGALVGETRERFETFYLSSPRRRAKLKLAETFARGIAREVETRDNAPVSDRAGGRAAGLVHAAEWTWLNLAAAAAVVVMLVGGALLIRDMRARTRQVEAQSAALDQRARDLQRQLEEQRATNAGSTRELERLRGELAAALAQQSAAARSPSESAGSITATALLLLPQTRAAGPVATLSIPAGAASVAVALRLEANDFPRYEVALKDPGSNEIVWRSGPLAVTALNRLPTVSVLIPVSVLKPQHYSIELMGRRAAGNTETVGSYAVQIAGR